MPHEAAEALLGIPGDHTTHDTAWSGQGPPRQSCVASFVASPLPTSGAGGAQEAHMMLARTTRLKPEMRLSQPTPASSSPCIAECEPEGERSHPAHELSLSNAHGEHNPIERPGEPVCEKFLSSRYEHDAILSRNSHGGASPPLHNRSAHT